MNVQSNFPLIDDLFSLRTIQDATLKLGEINNEVIRGNKETNELLYQMIPENIAEKLKNKDKLLVAEAFESVSICFTDIAGFYQVDTVSV